jgi:hypothetical protein
MRAVPVASVAGWTGVATNTDTGLPGSLALCGRRGRLPPSANVQGCEPLSSQAGFAAARLVEPTPRPAARAS